MGIRGKVKEQFGISSILQPWNPLIDDGGALVGKHWKLWVVEALSRNTSIKTPMKTAKFGLPS